MFAAICDDTWKKHAQHAAHNPKFEKMRLFRHPSWWSLKKLNDPSTRLKVTTTLDNPHPLTHNAFSLHISDQVTILHMLWHVSSELPPTFRLLNARTSPTMTEFIPRHLAHWSRIADNIFKCIFLNENVRILLEISLKFVPRVPINNIPALVQIMAWRRPGDKPLSESMMD